MSDLKLPSRSENFAEWYNELVLRADLADYGPARGTMVVKPYGWALWENIQRALDERFKRMGAENCAFPMFIPKSFLEKEKAHVEGFSPELAVVTIGGGEELAEPLVVRPTSETIIGHKWHDWIKSHRDLPMRLNLWNSVVRWEMRTKLFLRTAEFYWQEGHCAYATHDEAEAETLWILNNAYGDMAETLGAIPGVRGRKSESERFAGALRSYSIEAMMGDTRALQSCTSHNLGQNFAQAFEIQYLDKTNTLQHCWTSSWGLSTRFIGAIIMTHGDDQGLVLPPKLAPIQVVIVPIYKNDAEKGPVLEAVARIKAQLLDAGVRVKVDEREGLSPGFKFNDWELRGVPVRLEIGPKDVAKNSVAVARRDKPGKAGKAFVAQEGLIATLHALLNDIQQALYDRALAFRQANTHDPQDYGAFKQVLEKGWALSWWCGRRECEAQIKEDTKASTRNLPLEQPGGSGTCIHCGQPAQMKAIFARSY
jgi:prolyl-tRNA synthetase